MILKASDVFTPGVFPSHTYVARDSEHYETRLNDGLERSGMLTLVVGPSKSGKTVLVEKVTGVGRSITISGSDISKPEDLWFRVLSVLQIPIQSKGKIDVISSTADSVGVSGKFGIPLVAEAVPAVSGTTTNTLLDSRESTFAVAGLERAVSELVKHGKVLVIDDFHYIPEDAQIVLSKQIKEVIRRGVRTVILLVPHRAEDPLRANPDLRGRILEINVARWDASSLKQIGQKGFDKLNFKLPESEIQKLADESLGSPQLMQLLCLESCMVINRKGLSSGLGEDGFREAAHRAAETSNARTIFEILRKGPPRHGTERTTYPIKGREGLRGDNYQLILEALRRDPARIVFPIEDLRSRIEGIVDGDDLPQKQQITTSLQKWNELLNKKNPPDRVLEWKDDPPELYITDPYFLFYMRWTKDLVV